tara:strand:+ start:663 stop:941 length:279 start_codon:yes stop_codon:yes gene_type:complete
MIGDNLIKRLITETSELPVHPIKSNQIINGKTPMNIDIQKFLNHPYLTFDFEKIYKTNGITNTINNPQTMKKCIGLDVMSTTGARPENWLSK